MKTSDKQRAARFLELRLQFDAYIEERAEALDETLEEAAAAIGAAERALLEARKRLEELRGENAGRD
jgi:hypothetical protein